MSDNGYPLIINIVTGQIGVHNPKDVSPGTDGKHKNIGFYPLAKRKRMLLPPKIVWMYEIPISAISEHLYSPSTKDGICHAGYIIIRSDGNDDKGLFGKAQVDFNAKADALEDILITKQIQINDSKAEAFANAGSMKRKVTEIKQISNVLRNNDSKENQFRRPGRIYEDGEV